MPPRERAKISPSFHSIAAALKKRPSKKLSYAVIQTEALAELTKFVSAYRGYLPLNGKTYDGLQIIQIAAMNGASREFFEAIFNLDARNAKLNMNNVIPTEPPQKFSGWNALAIAVYNNFILQADVLLNHGATLIYPEGEKETLASIVVEYSNHYRDTKERLLKILTNADEEKPLPTQANQAPRPNHSSSALTSDFLRTKSVHTIKPSIMPSNSNSAFSSMPDSHSMASLSSASRSPTAPAVSPTNTTLISPLTNLPSSNIMIGNIMSAPTTTSAESPKLSSPSASSSPSHRAIHDQKVQKLLASLGASLQKKADEHKLNGNGTTPSVSPQNSSSVSSPSPSQPSSSSSRNNIRLFSPSSYPANLSALGSSTPPISTATPAPSSSSSSSFNIPVLPLPSSRNALSILSIKRAAPQDTPVVNNSATDSQPKQNPYKRKK